MIHQLEIKRILLTGLALFAAIILCVNLAIFGYGVFLGFQAQGTPDSQKIADFAVKYAPWITIASSLVFSFYAGRRTARRAEHQKNLHSLLIGVIVSLLLVMYGILFYETIWYDVITGVVILLCSWMGAKSCIRSK